MRREKKSVEKRREEVINRRKGGHKHRSNLNIKGQTCDDRLHSMFQRCFEFMCLHAIHVLYRSNVNHMI